MSMEDPFFVVREEVQKAVSNAQSLYNRWQELLNDSSAVGKEEYNWTTNELRNSIRSIEWDLEDLDETIGIVESNPRKFSLDPNEVGNRKQFVKQTRDLVARIKDHLNSSSTKTKVESSNRQALMGNKNGKPKDRYSRLDREIERSNQDYIEDQQQSQQLLMNSQDDQLELVEASVGILKNMGKRIGDEVDEQNVLLDDLGHEIDMTDSKLQQVMVKVEKVMRLTNDKRQNCVLFSLIIIMIIVVILFVAL